MTPPGRIIADNHHLRQHYHALAAGDLVVGRVRLAATEEQMFAELLERGIRFFPSARSQLASRSKLFQAMLFCHWMVPETRPIHDRHQLQQALAHYGKLQIGPVVTKQDRANAGLGVHFWPSLEAAYNQASLGTLPFPFVLQPFLAECRDVRVVVLGEHLEAYQRSNPSGFRQNLHFGGHSQPWRPSQELLDLCRAVMAHGDFPYGHLDLLLAPDGGCYLSEINLRGGLRGARISGQEYNAILEAIHRQAADHYRKTGRLPASPWGPAGGKTSTVR